MADGYSLDGYIEVPDRILAFKEKYPDGTLQGDWSLEEVGDATFVVYVARAYRTADDERPAVGMAWEPYPGKTPYTKDSEVMNAETSAWGRAIVAAGIPSKKIASAEEVRNRQGSAGAATEPSTSSSPGASSPSTPAPAGTPLPFGAHKGKTLEAMVAAGGKEKGYVEWIAGTKFEPKSDEQRAIKQAAIALVLGDVEAEIAGAFPNDDDIPFAASWA
jgi:hypothetical protein